MSNLHVKLSASAGNAPVSLYSQIPELDIESVSVQEPGSTSRTVFLLDDDNEQCLDLGELSSGWVDTDDVMVVPGSVVPVHVAQIAVTLDKAPQLETEINRIMQEI